MPIMSKKQNDRLKDPNTPLSHPQPLPSPPDDPSRHYQLLSHPIPPRNELAFHCQLAHGSATREIKSFSNVKELYAKIGQAFDIDPDTVIFCTLNTHKIDMTRLLGGQIGLDDFIFAHVKGNTKTVTITKQESSIGLTITDNGAGNAFIKRIKEGSVAAELHSVCVGDMVQSINEHNLKGTKHYEVAKILKELPRYCTFNIGLTEPMKPFAVATRNTIGKSTIPLSQLFDDSSSTNEGKGTLRLKKDGGVSYEENVSPWLSKVIERIDDQLERFMGIRDHQLSHLMVELSQGQTTVDDYALALDNGGLMEFQFPDEFILDIWRIIKTT